MTAPTTSLSRRSTWPPYRGWIWCDAPSRRPAPPRAGWEKRSATAVAPPSGAGRPRRPDDGAGRGRAQTPAIRNPLVPPRANSRAPTGGRRRSPRERFSPGGTPWSGNRSPNMPSRSPYATAFSASRRNPPPGQPNFAWCSRNCWPRSPTPSVTGWSPCSKSAVRRPLPGAKALGTSPGGARATPTAEPPTTAAPAPPERHGCAWQASGGMFVRDILCTAQLGVQKRRYRIGPVRP